MCSQHIPRCWCSLSQVFGSSSPEGLLSRALGTGAGGMSCLCPGQELEWRWDLLSMVGVSCENPQNPPAKAAQGFLPVQFNSSVGCSLQFLSQGCFPLGFKSVVSLQGASGSHCWIWLCWCSSVHPHFGKLLFPRPLTALSCCGQLPQAPRATQGVREGLEVGAADSSSLTELLIMPGRAWGG